MCWIAFNYKAEKGTSDFKIFLYTDLFTTRIWQSSRIQNFTEIQNSARNEILEDTFLQYLEEFFNFNPA